MIDTIVSGFNEIVNALKSVFLALENMLFALIQLPSMAIDGGEFLLRLINCLPSVFMTFFIFGCALAVIQWALPGRIGGK